MADEQDWMLGQYIYSAFATVMSKAFNKNSDAKYIEEPVLTKFSNEKEEPKGESAEMIAAAEFQKFAIVMKRQGLPECKESIKVE